MKKAKSLLPLPIFQSEADEAKFWLTHDSTDYIDWNQAIHMEFPNLKPSTKSITLRLPVNLLNRIKKIANKKDVPYQSLMKVFLDEKSKEGMLTTA